MDLQDSLMASNSLLQRLEDFYRGKSWVTDQVGTVVFDMDSTVAFKKITGYHHSVAEQLAHLIAWRNFAVQKFSGNDNFDLEDNSPEDWPEPNDWSQLRDQFAECHQNLLASIRNFDPQKWDALVPLRAYSFLYLANGIIEHDYYHFGQINALLAAIRTAGPSC